jgi:hypothetical protein
VTGNEKMIKTSHCLIALLVLTTNSPAFCEEASLEKMKQRCQQARETKIAPLREAAIEECASNRRSSRTHEDCERIYRDFGEGGGTATGGFRPGMFNDLPECVEYFEARDRQGTDRPRR